MFIASAVTACLMAVANAAPEIATKVSTSVHSKQTCITKFKNVSSNSAFLPTSTHTSVQTVCSTFTTCGTLSTVTLTITPATSTTTVFVNGTDSVRSQTILITASASAPQACSSKGQRSASAVTVYTGSYNGTIAKRMTRHAGVEPGPDLSSAHPHFDVLHRFGQKAIGSGQKPFRVDCLEQITSYLFTTTTIADKPTMETVTVGAPTVTITQTQKVTSLPTASVTITSNFTNSTQLDTAAAGDCTVHAATPSTTTQHIKCAPTNLIGSVNGYGIYQTGGSSNATQGLAPGSDPSACCQLCVDTEGCAASEDDPDAGNCFLWYTNPSCGLGFKYSDGGQHLRPGAGFLLQTGCGTIEAVHSID